MKKVKCGNCGNIWEAEINFRPLFCAKCGAEWLKADLYVILPKEFICAFSHSPDGIGVVTDRWVEWNEEQQKFIDRKP
jgi:hypothetical protein